jgi:ATP-dependent helicase HrpA
MTGVRLPEDVWNFENLTMQLPVHLTMNFKVVDEKGNTLQQGRNLNQLKAELQAKVKTSIQKVAEKGIEKSGLTEWNFGLLPKGYEKKIANITIKAFPALVDHKNSVAIELFEQEEQAQNAMLKGISRLVLLNIPSPIKYLQEKLPNKAKLGLYFNPFGSIHDLLQDCIQGASFHLVQYFADNQRQGLLPQTEAEFNLCRDYVRSEIASTVLDAAIKVEKALSLRYDISKKLKGNVALNIIQSHSDIKQQGEQLIFKGFITASGLNLTIKKKDLIRLTKSLKGNRMFLE